eukprot:TRINITY_DN4805_c0_g1_i1.p1 TRINITY_DN4805_c0_g1~~TRINITY_DN4805_c0_g1_i1.p1  ORF type:complete len:847 (+),score=102.86 TRINITY_DN4805_c0_g1_i1:172-2712(+)
MMADPPSSVYSGLERVEVVEDRPHWPANDTLDGSLASDDLQAAAVNSNTAPAMETSTEVSTNTGLERGEVVVERSHRPGSASAGNGSSDTGSQNPFAVGATNLVEGAVRADQSTQKAFERMNDDLKNIVRVHPGELDTDDYTVPPVPRMAFFEWAQASFEQYTNAVTERRKDLTYAVPPYLFIVRKIGTTQDLITQADLLARQPGLVDLHSEDTLASLLATSLSDYPSIEDSTAYSGGPALCYMTKLTEPPPPDRLAYARKAWNGASLTRKEKFALAYLSRNTHRPWFVSCVGSTVLRKLCAQPGTLPVLDIEVCRVLLEEGSMDEAHALYEASLRKLEAFLHPPSTADPPAANRVISNLTMYTVREYHMNLAALAPAARLDRCNERLIAMLPYWPKLEIHEHTAHNGHPARHCLYWQRGSCRHGDRCHYFHGDKQMDVGHAPGSVRFNSEAIGLWLRKLAGDALTVLDNESEAIRRAEPPVHLVVGRRSHSNDTSKDIWLDVLLPLFRRVDGRLTKYIRDCPLGGKGCKRVPLDLMKKVARCTPERWVNMSAIDSVIGIDDTEGLPIEFVLDRQARPHVIATTNYCQKNLRKTGLGDIDLDLAASFVQRVHRFAKRWNDVDDVPVRHLEFHMGEWVSSKHLHAHIVCQLEPYFAAMSNSRLYSVPWRTRQLQQTARSTFLSETKESSEVEKTTDVGNCGAALEPQVGSLPFFAVAGLRTSDTVPAPSWTVPASDGADYGLACVDITLANSLWRREESEEAEVIRAVLEHVFAGLRGALGVEGEDRLTMFLLLPFGDDDRRVRAVVPPDQFLRLVPIDERAIWSKAFEGREFPAKDAVDFDWSFVQ